MRSCITKDPRSGIELRIKILAEMHWRKQDALLVAGGLGCLLEATLAF